MNETSQNNDNGWGLGKLLLFVVFAVAAVIVATVTPMGHYFSAEHILGITEDLGYKGILILILVGTVMPVFFMPRWPVAWVSGLLYGVCGGALLATFASTLGACLQYYLASNLLAQPAAKTLKQFNISFNTVPDRRIFSFFLFLRAFPLSNFVATNLLAGALRVRMKIYIAATFLGMIPSSIMYASWGKVMKERTTSFMAVAVFSVLFIVVGCVLARKRYYPWLKQFRA